LTNELPRAPDFSLLVEDRLIAYLWRDETGGLAVASAKEATAIAACAFATIKLFDRRHAEKLTAVVAASTDFDALLFKLGLEGFDVVAGAVAPDARRRRF